EDQRLDLVSSIDAVTAMGRQAGPLQGVVAATKVGVMGHSDGGIVAAALGFSTDAADPRVGADVVIAGDYGYFGGPWFPDGSPPLLAIHGDADTVNSFATSARMFDADDGGTKYLVTILDGGHLDPLLEEPTRTPLVRLISDFFSAYLRNDRRARS